MRRTLLRDAGRSRHSLRLAAVLSALALTACGAPADTETLPAGPDALLGVWVPTTAPERLLTAAGQPPPLNGEAAALHAARLERLAAGDTSFDQTTWCASPGMPRVMTMPYPFEIRRDGDFLAFIHGWYRWFRVVNLAGIEVDPPLPLTGGFPVGHWEGDTLVIRTGGLSDVAVLDASGLPRSEEMVLTERLRVLADGRLEDRITIDDPETFTEPWETVLHFRRDAAQRVTDDVCPDRIAAGEPAVRKELPAAPPGGARPAPAASSVIEIEVTIEDPEYYEAPFTIKRAWNRSTATHPLEYDCMENPRQEDFENAYYVRDRYRPTCMRVKGEGAELSRVVCRRREE